MMIPISRSDFDRFRNTMSVHDYCTHGKLEVVFVVSEMENSRQLLDHLLLHILFDEPPPNDSSESMFHMFWDVNIRRTLEVFVSGGFSVHHS
ncbi:hypothetical protein BC938DRAFT_482973, partial [Jimgerdemannia flammicorona]